MEEKKQRICEGKTEAFLICDRSLGKNEAPFYKWLREEGFTHGYHKGNFGCPWAYVNITRKQFAYGMPGVGIVQPIGEHAITIEEFQTIYSIYKKYEGKNLFVFHSERFDYDS